MNKDLLTKNIEEIETIIKEQFSYIQDIDDVLIQVYDDHPENTEQFIECVSAYLVEYMNDTLFQEHDFSYNAQTHAIIFDDKEMDLYAFSKEYEKLYNEANEKEIDDFDLDDI